MPWNDTSKPPRKPGPWESPAEGDRGATSDPTVKPRRTSVDAPWAKRPPTGKPSAASPREARAPERKGSTPPARGPHLDELSRQLRGRLAEAALRPSDRRLRIGVVLGALGLVAVAWALSGLYVVQNDEVASVARFGAPVNEAGPGLHYRLPFPFETVRRLSLGVQRIGLGSTDGDDATGGMLTADGDLVVPAYTVQWRIDDPKVYLSGLADPEMTLRLDAASALRETIGQLPLAQVLAAGHGQAGIRAELLLQAALDHDKAGIRIIDLQVRDVVPPDGAQGGFHDIAAAETDAQVGQREADAYRTRVVAEATADAAKLVQTSQGYRDQEVSEAKGEAARFTLIDAQAKKAPQATRDRLYTETMERVLHNTPKVIIPSSGAGSAPIVLPPDLFRPKPADAPAPAPQPPSAAAAASGPSA